MPGPPVISPRQFHCEVCGAPPWSRCKSSTGRETESYHPPRRAAAARERDNIEAFAAAKNNTLQPTGEVSRTTCRGCGAAVAWVPRPGRDGGKYPPQEVLHEERVLLGNRILTLPVVRRHICGEDGLAAHEAERAERARLFEEASRAELEARRMQERREAVELGEREGYRNARDAATEVGMKVSCTRCGAEPGVRCVNLRERAKGVDKPTAWPHSERLAAAGWDGPLP